MDSLEDRIKQHAYDLGFDLVGIVPAAPADGFERLRAWLELGCAGTMDYMHRHAEARRHPSSILPEVRSVVMVGMSYKPGARGQGSGVRSQESEASGGRQPPVADSALSTQHSALGSRHAPRATRHGFIASYARGDDYHDVLRRKLNHFLEWMQTDVPGCKGRGVVDTAPLLERDFARRAGLGWIGKNTMLLNPRLGSYLFLGALLLDVELRADPPFPTSHCGTCTACLTACPTQAFIEPGLLDARRCISYLTIELKEAIPTELRPLMGDWLFGCDVCQDVCPWNRKAPPEKEFAAHRRSDLEALAPIELLGMSEEEFRQRFRGTPLTRPKRRGLLRNAAIVLGNRGDPAALPALEQALADPDPIIREAVQWAIARIKETRNQSG